MNNVGLLANRLENLPNNIFYPLRCSITRLVLSIGVGRVARGLVKRGEGLFSQFDLPMFADCCVVTANKTG